MRSGQHTSNSSAFAPSGAPKRGAWTDRLAVLIAAAVLAVGCSGGADGPSVAQQPTAGVPAGGGGLAKPGNQPPIARISSEYETRYVRPGDVVSMNGAGSYDPDGDGLVFEWQLTSLPAGSVAALSDATAAETSFVADLAGDYGISLVVSDRTDYSAPDLATVTARRHSPQGFNWGMEAEVDTGEDPDVAVNNLGVVVEVHESPTTYDLWYRVGLIRGGLIEWGSSHYYDTGIKPSVDLNDDGVVVEMHSNELGTVLWYHVGEVDVQNRTINFGGAIRHDTGRRPSIAINNRGQVIEVHSSEVCIPNPIEDVGCGLWYQVGEVDLAARRIHFGGSHKYDSGLNPSVDLNDDGLLVEVHESQNHDDLWYWTGRLNPAAKTFTKLAHGRYDTGRNPAVAINSAGRVVEVHESENTITLWSSIGAISGTDLQLGAAHPYNFGKVPTVALNDRDEFIAMHDYGDVSVLPTSRILALLSQDFQPVKDAARWMELTPTMHRKTLRQVLLPGTHDSAAYQLYPVGPSGPESARGPDWQGIEKSCSNIPGGWLGDWLVDRCKDWLPNLAPQTENEVALDLTLAQRLGIGEQLRSGIRYFDLRVTIRDGAYRAYHGLLGNEFEPMLDEIRQFLQEVESEFVILSVSHLDVGTHELLDSRGFTPEEHDRLMALLVEKLGDYLYDRDGRSAEGLLATQFRRLVADGPRVLIVYVDDYLGDHPEHPLARHFWSGFFRGGYLNSTSLAEQEADQRTKLQEFLADRPPDRLFTLYQTLTADATIAAKNVIYDRVLGSDYRPSLHVLSQDVNQHLSTFLDDAAPGFPNIVLVDFSDESDVVARAIEISGLCNVAAITGQVTVIPPRTWPPNHQMAPIEVDVSGLFSQNPDSFQAYITGVEVVEPDRKTGDNIYGANNFEPDWEVTGELTGLVRAERDGRATERSYRISIEASDCSGDYAFIGSIVVPHDQGR